MITAEQVGNWVDANPDYKVGQAITKIPEICFEVWGRSTAPYPINLSKERMKDLLVKWAESVGTENVGFDHMGLIQRRYQQAHTGTCGHEEFIGTFPMYENLVSKSVFYEWLSSLSTPKTIGLCRHKCCSFGSEESFESIGKVSPSYWRRTN